MSGLKNKTKVLFTDVGHPVTSEALKNLREADNNFYFIGVDNSRETMGFLWVDKFYVIPQPSDPNYINSLLEVAVKERVDLIIPWTNEEALVIAKSSRLFKNEGIKLLNNTESTIRRLVDKGSMYNNLKVKGFPVPNFRLASNIQEIEHAIISLGYPKTPVVVKPRNLSGARGFCIIGNNVDLDKRGFGNKLPLKSFVSLLRESKNTENLSYLIMEFLSGKDFSVDCLCKKGEPIFIIPRTRLSEMGGVSLIGETTDDLKVRKLVKRVIKSFNLTYNINIQLRYRKSISGEPFIYDINPRISGTIVANSGAGIDLLYYGIKLALGKSIPEPENIKYRGVKMVRYWGQKFVKTNKKFNAGP